MYINQMKELNMANEQMVNLADLFEGQELSEEFKTKATTIFEAAVAQRVAAEVATIEKDLTQETLDESEELKQGLVDKVDGYLDYVVEEWMKKNELALDRGIKTEIFESFIGGMKTLFEEHYINVPDEQLDIMEEVDSRANALEEQVDALTAQNVQLQQTLKGIEKATQIDEASEGLSDMEAERFKELAEELAYDDEESFGKKLSIIKENYFKTKPAVQVVESVVTDSLPTNQLTEEAPVIDPVMQKYAAALKLR